MRPPITPQKIGCFQLIALMFIPLAFSMDCQNKTDTKEWSLFAVCWETSGKISDPCMWANPQFEGRRQNYVYGTTNITDSHRASHVLYHCSAILELPLSSGLYEYYIYFAASPKNPRKAVELRIDDPETPILQDCPAKAYKGDTIECKCKTAETGNPPPILSWKGHTSSATLRLADVRREHNKTYMCEMAWGNQTKTVSFSLLVLSGRDDEDDSVSNGNKTSPSAVIVGVAGAAVLVIIIATVIVFVTIRRKRGVSTSDTSDTGGSEEKRRENRLYVNVLVGGRRELERPHDDYAEVSDANRDEDLEEAVQTDLYAVVQENSDMPGSHLADVYAVVEKNKAGQPELPDLYAAVEKSKGKKQTQKAKSASPGPGAGPEKREITNEGDVYAVVDKGDKNVRSDAFAADEMYAQVVKFPK